MPMAMPMAQSHHCNHFAPFRKGNDDERITCKLQSRTYLLAAIVHNSWLPNKKVGTPNTDRYLIVSNMFSWVQYR